MADVKISALPASTTPLAGTEVLPIVQSGTTVQVSVANLTAGRAINASTATMSGLTTAPQVNLTGNVSAAAWTTTGVGLTTTARTLTDTSSSGTVATGYTNVLGGNTIAASNSTTFTNYSTMFMAAPTAGTNVTLTNSFSLVTAGNIGIGSTDVVLTRDAADILAQRRGTTAQAFRVYNTFTDASNFERVQLYTSGTSGGVGWSQAGSGSARNFLVSGNQLVFQSGSSYLNRWIISSSGNFVAADDNTYDIGASGATRPRNLYMSSWIRMAVVTVATLPAAATAGAGARMMVSDASVPVFGNAVAGGGAVTVPVYSDGAAWNVG